MNKEKFEKIKENVYTRCNIAIQTGIGLTTPDKEEIELIDEITQLTNNWNELEKDINNQLMMTRKFDDYNEGFFDATLHYYNKMKEIKGDK